MQRTWRGAGTDGGAMPKYMNIIYVVFFKGNKIQIHYENE